MLGKQRDGCELCYYCDGVLSSRHEHDHFPVPAVAGGTEKVPVCINCHDIKDRTRFADLPVEFAIRGVMELIVGVEDPVLVLSAALSSDNGSLDKAQVLLDGFGDIIGRWSTLSSRGRIVYAKVRRSFEELKWRSDQAP